VTLPAAPERDDKQDPPRPSPAVVRARLPSSVPTNGTGAPSALEPSTSSLMAPTACSLLRSPAAPARSPERLSASPIEWQAGPDTNDYDYDAASEALDGSFNRFHENRLRQQEKELLLLYEMNGLTIPFGAWIARCEVDLRHLYICERQELGTLVNCTDQQYAKFATDPMGRTRKRKRADGSDEFRPNARFPGSFIPGCFTETEAKQFRERFNRPKRTEAEKRRRSKISKAKADDHAALDSDVGLDPMTNALVRVLDRWKTPLDAARALRRRVGWKSMRPQSRKRRINEMVPGLVASGYIEIKPGSPRKIRCCRR
jgi:hypothetical protein